MALIDTSGLARFLVRLKEIFFLKSGGTISGDTNVAGVLRVQSQQAFYTPRVRRRRRSARTTPPAARPSPVDLLQT